MLRTLNLSSNKLGTLKEKGAVVKGIPSDLSSLIKLEKLVLDRNEIAELPTKYPKSLQVNHISLSLSSTYSLHQHTW